MGGGGSSSGSVNYPSAMKNVFYNWLYGWTTAVPDTYDYMTFSVVDLMNAAMRDGSGGLPYSATGTNSPYYNLTATDPDGAFFGSASSLSTYVGQSPFELLKLFLLETPETLYTTYATDYAASTMISAFTNDLNTQYNNTIIPDLANGFANINAVQSSSYAHALAQVAGQKVREVAKITGQIKTQIALQRVQVKMEWRRLLSTFSIENSRIYLAAKHEEDESNTHYASENALWDLNIYQFGTQVMASISGSSTQKAPNNKPSTLGAAFSGAATGALIASSLPDPTGTSIVIGASIGAIAGIASTM